MSSITPTSLNSSTGTACSSPPTWTEPKRRLHPSSLRRDAVVISSPPAPQVPAGTTPTPWPYSDLHRGSFTGQFGFLHIDSGSDPGQYDQEIFLSLRDWEPFFTSNMEDTDEEGQTDPQLEKPAVLNTDPNGLEVNSITYSINDKSLGAGDPVRVKEGQRILFRFLNASAIENRRIALPGHKFKVIALDGNPVPTPQSVETLFLGAGERIDAIVEMNNPGVWILGATEDPIRAAGLGIVVEYANQHRQPQWVKPSTLRWDYTPFGAPGRRSALPYPRPYLRHGLRKDSRRLRQIQHLAGQR